jgi:hypothetical protein
LAMPPQTPVIMTLVFERRSGFVRLKAMQPPSGG